MRERSFSVVTAYLKTEPVQTALFGVAVLGDSLTAWAAFAITVATLGVVLISTKPGMGLAKSGLRPVLMGIAAGAFFALSAVAFRGAILSLEEGSFLMRATSTLAWSLALQTGLLLAWLVLFDRPALVGSLRAWRFSVGAGFLGALASQFWFIGFALTTAANVRTLALVEVVMAQAVSHRLLAQKTSRRELAGLALIVAGVALLLVSQG
jgi:drug/metabolite transporter (DMT)-like permease